MFGSTAVHFYDLKFRLKEENYPEVEAWLREHRMGHWVTRCVSVTPHPMGGRMSTAYNGMIEVEFRNKADATLFKLRWC